MKLICKHLLLVLSLMVLAGCSPSKDTAAPDAPADKTQSSVESPDLQKTDKEKTKPVVSLNTSMGSIVIEFDPAKAPITVENFLGYVKGGYYDGLIFHRVIPGFMIQGGGMKEDMVSASPGKAIKNESNNGLSNVRGTIAMARTNDPDSATSQFFINQADNTFLDYKPNQAGYTVFGHVITGMDVVDKIAKVDTGYKQGHKDVPEKPVIITKAEIVKTGPDPKANEE